MQLKTEILPQKWDNGYYAEGKNQVVGRTQTKGSHNVGWNNKVKNHDVGKISIAIMGSSMQILQEDENLKFHGI